jgi:hypothetical protein
MPDDPTRGLYGKYRVQRADGTSAPGEKHDGCQYFVLDCHHDPYALPALLAYAKSCREAYPALSKDLARLVGTFQAGESGRWSAQTIARAEAEVAGSEEAGDAPPGR